MARRIDPRLGEFARAMRREPTPPERALWRAVSARKLDGLKFRRQAVIDGVIVDFHCPEAGLVVELDGNSHDDPALDARRDARLLATRGLRVLRFSNQQLGQDLDGVLRAILHAARCARTLPQPLPLQGRGAESPDTPLPACREGQGEGASRSEAGYERSEGASRSGAGYEDPEGASRSKAGYEDPEGASRREAAGREGRR